MQDLGYRQASLSSRISNSPLPGPSCRAVFGGFAAEELWDTTPDYPRASLVWQAATPSLSPARGSDGLENFLDGGNAQQHFLRAVITVIAEAHLLDEAGHGCFVRPFADRLADRIVEHE